MENWAKKDSFFACKVPRVRMNVPESSIDSFYIHGLTSGEKDEYENTVMQLDAGSRKLKMENARAVLMQMTIHDQHGNRMFDAKDIGRLAKVPAHVADPILKVARRLSAMETGEIEKLVKNSEAAPEPGSEDSGSGSPDTSAAQKPK